MASKTTLNAKNLEALGAARLAELLIEISTGNAVAKRRLRLELAGTEGPAAMAKEVRRRLTTIAQSRSFVEWHQVKALAADLEAQHRAIVERVAKADPVEAHDLLWRFLHLADDVLGRCDDSNGRIAGVFDNAAGGLRALAEAAKADPKMLGARVFDFLNADPYERVELIGVLAPVLGKEGLAQLRARFLDLAKTPVTRPPQDQRKVVMWSSQGKIYEDDIEARRRESTTRLALEAIADAEGDVDAFIAQQEGKAKGAPQVAVAIARRLLDAGRTEEALKAIEAVDMERQRWLPYEWQDTKIEILDALGRAQEAQECRLAFFKEGLRADLLRDYLKRLPDFEDEEAERRALAHVESQQSLLKVLDFLTNWPALERASAVILKRAAELDGNQYELLVSAAKALEEKHPLAATLLLRSMIDHALDRAKSARYPHAARHLKTCEELAARIHDYAGFPSHDAFSARLKGLHARKHGFWSYAS